MSDELLDEINFEAAPPSVGATLKSARAAMGLSVLDAGSRLRLMARQIEAMEADDFASLGQPVFSRGFVRNYARLLGLDPEPLLAQMVPADVPPPPKVENVPFAPKPGFWTSPWVMGAIAAVVLVVALPVTLYFWLNSGEEEDSAVQQIEQVALPPSPPPAPVAEVTPDMQPEPQPGVPDQAGVQPGAVLAPAPAVTPASGVPAQAAAPMSTPGVPAMPTQLAPPAAQAMAPAVTPLVANGARQSIQFKFAQPAWLQVRDATGKMVHSALNMAGTTTEVSGVPPFTLVVGNAANVQVAYKNKPVDIKPYIDVTVARFTLN
jgi:cytoskeleton protein RodZ